MNRVEYIHLKESLPKVSHPSQVALFLVQMLCLAGVSTLLVTSHSLSAFRFLAIPMISIFMFRSFGLMHEAVHGVATRNRKWNAIFGVVFGTFCLLSFESWKNAHLAHHKWSGNLDKDPVMGMIKIYPTFPRWLQKTLTLGWQVWLPALSFLQHSLFWSITVKFTLKQKLTAKSVLSVVPPIAFWCIFVALAPRHFLLQQFAPAVVLYLLGTEIINAPHHLGLKYFRGDTQIPVWEQYRTARSCVYPKWLARFVVLNFNYHAEHHMYPTLPWYQLDQIHPFVNAKLGTLQMLEKKFSWVKENRKRELGLVFGSNQIGSDELNRAGLVTDRNELAH